MSIVTQTLSLLSTLFMLVTIPVYIVFLLTLHKNRHDELLRSPFFRLMFSLGIADLCQIFTVLLGNKLSSTGWVPEFYIWMGGLSARLQYCAAFGFGYAQIIAVLMIAVNRLTAYVFPIKHMKIWTDSFTRIVIIVQWTVAVVLILPIAFVFQYNIDIDTDNRIVYFQWTNASENGLYSMLAAGLLGTEMMIVIVIIYTIIFATALIRKIRSQESMSKSEKLALSMAVVGFLCSIGFFLFLGDLLAQLIAWNVFQYNFLDIDTNRLINDIGQSIFASIDPYAVLLFSSTVRRRCAAMACFFKRKSQNGTSVSSVVPLARNNY